MKKIRVFLLCLTGITLVSAMPAYSRKDAYTTSVDIVDRGKNARKMVAPHMEYIASASYTTVQVTYNVFLHPELAQDASMPDLDPERILAEERMASESAKLCGNHIRANECIIFLWKNMSLISPGNKSFQRYGALGADGVFRIVKGKEGQFSWRHETQKKDSESLIAQTLGNDDTYSPYQRSVRASNRFLEGATMVAEDMEFISVESVMQMNMLYHVYLHSKKMRTMQTDDLSNERLQAEKEIVTESFRLCQRYQKADQCNVLLWGRLDDIPLNEMNVDYEKLRKQASGYYVFDKGKEPQFRWNYGE